MIEYPQDVRERVAAKLFSLFPRALDLGNDRSESLGIIREAVDNIIPLAQLPIAPATEVEKQQYLRDCEDAESPGSADTVYSPLYRFISRRNSPPKVDPLVEKIIAVQHRVRVEAVENCTIGRLDTVLREAEAIAAEVRKFAALESRLDAARA